MQQRQKEPLINSILTKDIHDGRLPFLPRNSAKRLHAPSPTTQYSPNKKKLTSKRSVAAFLSNSESDDTTSSITTISQKQLSPVVFGTTQLNCHKHYEKRRCKRQQQKSAPHTTVPWYCALCYTYLCCVLYIIAH